MRQVQGGKILVHVYGLDSSTDTWYDMSSGEISVMEDRAVLLVWDEVDDY